MYKSKTEYQNVYEYTTPRKKRDDLVGTFTVMIHREGKRIIHKHGFPTADAARKAGDLALIKAGYPQINGTFKFVEKSVKKSHTEGFAN